MTTKLNTMRILEQHKIPYEALAYPDDIKDAELVAEALGIPYFMVYKTLVVEAEGQNKPALVMLASERHLDLKKTAVVLGAKKARLAAHKDAERLTGLKVGGISALALREKNWPVYLDNAATELEHICISAGQRGTQLRVPVTPLVSLLRARLADVSADEDVDEA